jgi:hypothetical protein
MLDSDKVNYNNYHIHLYLNAHLHYVYEFLYDFYKKIIYKSHTGFNDYVVSSLQKSYSFLHQFTKVIQELRLLSGCFALILPLTF